MADSSTEPIFDSEVEWKELLEATPENLQDDPLNLYFRCEYSKRAHLLECLTTAECRKINSELERIEKLRGSFTHEDHDNIRLVQTMTAARGAWRTLAKTKCRGERTKLEKLQSEGKSESQPEFDRHLDHLKKVSEWTIKLEGLPDHSNAEDDKAYGFSAYEIGLKKSPRTASYGSYSITSYPLNDVLYNEESSPLSKKCDENTIRYFHFPANNMLWVEEAIARYYEEQRGEYNYRRSKTYREKSSNLLCREFWTAQQHGGISDPIHARHMRSHCSFISTEKDSRNFVIFMPYLHWETDKRRRKMAEIMKEVTHNHQRELQKEFPYLNEEFHDEFAEQVSQAQIKYGTKIPTEELDKEPVHEPRKHSALGAYLMAVANVYDALDIEPDMRCLRNHLHETPPLHPRRTLDQSYHWKLENTGKRDEDQVVYRGTKAGRSIYRETKTVMVDQLWLYILDERTILSFFPRRWGRNKPDFSGVHKSIRSTLEHLREGEIQSIYDLAVVIMNQCSTVFFDRTKPTDDRPQVLDIFANAIAHVSEMKTVAFENFWRHLDKMHLNNPSLKDIEVIELAARVYLDVNPEGLLLREAHDILDELRMIGRIYFQQLRVARHFSKALQEINEQASPPTARELVRDVRAEIEGITDHKAGTLPHGGPHSRVSTMDINADTNKQRPIPYRTIIRAKSLLEDIETRQSELRDLEESTNGITDDLKYLLDLKQQQTSIIEAKAALARADESVTQGRAIMMFTIITIIFLPLSFMSSLFGMNAKELSGADGGIMSLHYQFKFMFPISLAVIVVSLALAFSGWIRNFISFIVSIVWAFITEYSCLRRAWKFCIKTQDAKGLARSRWRVSARIYGRRDRKENRKALIKAGLSQKKVEV